MRWGKEDGAVAVEFTLLLVFVIIPALFGMTTFGVMLSRLEGYESAAREGARYAAVNCQPRRVGDPGYGVQTTSPCTKLMIARAINEASTNPPIDPNALQVIPSDMDCSQHRGDPITVKWDQTFDLQTYPFNIGLGVRTRTIQGVFRCE